jgi:hypothetical protein
MTRLVTAASFVVGAALVGTGFVTTAHLSARAETTRTVYFSARDSTGTPVTDLTAADLAVKEGGKDRAITSVTAATAPMDVSLVIDDGGSGAFQAAVAQFLQATRDHGQFAIRLLNPQPLKIMDFTADADVLQATVGRLGPRGRVAVDAEQIIGAVSDVAKELKKRKSARPVIVVLSVSGEAALSDLADPTLNDLKSSGASLNVLQLFGVRIGKVLGDGPKQSGGVVESAVTGVVVGPMAARIAESLLSQYVLTYTLPDGVKPNERLSLTTTRTGVTITAPTRIADK